MYDTLRIRFVEIYNFFVSHSLSNYTLLLKSFLYREQNSDIQFKLRIQLCSLDFLRKEV